MAKFLLLLGAALPSGALGAELWAGTSWGRRLMEAPPRQNKHQDVLGRPCGLPALLRPHDALEDAGDNPHLAQVLVTQPYGYSLDEMIAFAAEKGLWFWISERPAWHFPKRVHFVEWAASGSVFARKRDTSAMHDLFQTRRSYTPGC